MHFVLCGSDVAHLSTKRLEKSNFQSWLDNGILSLKTTPFIEAKSAIAVGKLAFLFA
jgi:hypothetical protein